MNKLDSWRAFLRHVNMNKFVFGRGGGLSPPGAPTGLCPGPTRGLGGPFDPWPNLLFSKMTLLFHFIMKTLSLGEKNKLEFLFSL